jgi:hypothetical protein
LRGLGVRGQVVVELMGALTKQKGGEAKGRNVTPPSMDSGSKASTYGKAKGGTFINSFTQTGTPEHHHAYTKGGKWCSVYLVCRFNSPSARPTPRRLMY